MLLTLNFKLKSGLSEFFSDKKSTVAPARFKKARKIFFLENRSGSEDELKRRTKEERKIAKLVKLK